MKSIPAAGDPFPTGIRGSRGDARGPERERGRGREDAPAGAPAKKKTRRGSRGGRNRKTKTTNRCCRLRDATATVAAETSEAHPSRSGGEAQPENGDWAYTPRARGCGTSERVVATLGDR